MSDMKCPFCGQELDADSQSWEYGCSNPDCETAGTMCGTKELWQELIRIQELFDIESREHWMCHTQMLKTTEEVNRTRKALDVAIERLEQIAHESFQGDQQSINMGFHIRAAAALTDIEQITALEQKDVK